MTLSPLTRRPIMAALLGLVMALLLSVVVGTVAPPAATAAASKWCKQHSETIKAKMTREAPSYNGAGRAQAASTDDTPNYYVSGGFRKCDRGDHAHIWRGFVKYHFPAGTNNCGSRFQGASASMAWSYTGGAHKTVVVTCDGSTRTKRVNLDVDCVAPSPAPNPGLADVCSYTIALKAMWQARNDHHKKVGGGWHFG